ncbi:hypothetical protein QCA50_004520 [Cerrena zonata]|uniref:Integral membrane protein n=1 Tax=Cerrena zonata TaxID=2478898 RepID=A0AAW0GP89_9APHY
MADASPPTDYMTFKYIIHLSAGIYFWEFITSLWFEWKLVKGQLKFLKTLPVYFLLRYMALLAVIVTLVAFDRTAPMDCRATLFIFQISGSAVTGLATITLAMRATAIWGNRRSVKYPVIGLVLGHWILILHGILVEGRFVPGEGCVLTHIHNALLAANLGYTMLLDFLVLLLAAWGVQSFHPPSNRRIPLARLLVRDGIVYFLLSFVANLIATVFMVLNRNPIMSVMANIPAALTCAIASTRAVRALIMSRVEYESAVFDNVSGSIHYRPNSNVVHDSVLGMVELSILAPLPSHPTDPSEVTIRAEIQPEEEDSSTVDPTKGLHMSFATV